MDTDNLLVSTYIFITLRCFMPQLINGTIGLFGYLNKLSYDKTMLRKSNSDNCKSNQEYYELFLNSGEIIRPHNIQIPYNTELRIIYKNGDFELGLLDLKSKELIYFNSVMEVELSLDLELRCKKINAVYQNFVWRLDNSRCPKTFVKDIMLKYLLTSKRSLLSDSYQTQAGATLWHYILTMSFNKNDLVYVLTDCVRTTVTGIQSETYPVAENQLHHLKSLVWSTDDLSNVRLLVSRGIR